MDIFSLYVRHNMANEVHTDEFIKLNKAKDVH